ncbi:MAG: imidazolonepropionase [Clostridiales bacterium]|jgi:imidazolonepropionase|nr:imidazolonepropionase [Clostridiales bacterium]
MDLLLKNIGLLATPTGIDARRGKAQGEITLRSHAAVGIHKGRIVFVDHTNNSAVAEHTLDCAGKLVTPGLVDCHTHLVFGGWRQHEMKQKFAGVPYLEILKAGGGILNTVKATRSASEEDLFQKAQTLLREMLYYGTTTCEAKSGYGLELETELKQLRVIRRLNKAGPVELAATFMGAHAIPEEYASDREGYINLVCEEILPRAARENLAEFCDVFCDEGVFTPEESARVLKRASDLGLGLKAHADEISPVEGAEMAAECGCISAEHLIAASDAGIMAMAEKNVIAALLPATSFWLGKPYARACEMIRKNVPVAVATDFNPGSCPCLNLQFAMSLACLKYRLTPAEALTSVTLNGAAAIRRAESLGSVEPGKQADLIIWDAPDLDYIFYRCGSNLAQTIIKKGDIICRN